MSDVTLRKLPLSDMRSRKDLMFNIIQAEQGLPLSRICPCNTYSEKDLLYNIVLAAQQGGESPGGSDGQLQFNNAGAFGGVAGATWTGTTGTLDGFVIGGTTPKNANFIDVGASGVYGTNVAAGDKLVIGSGFGSDVLSLQKDAANTLAQRNGVNAQRFNIYGTYTDSLNYERGFFGVNGGDGEVIFGSEKAGTGSARGVHFYTNGIDRWVITGAGHLITATDNAFDIGASGANRPRNVYVAGVTTLGNQVNILAGGQPAIQLIQAGGGDSGMQLAPGNGGAVDTGVQRAGVATVKITDAGSGIGKLIFVIPTSNPGPGTLWNNAGVLTIGS